MRKNKILLPAAFLFAAISSAFAQGNGIAGITEATNMVTSYFDPGTKLIYAIGAVVGLIGGIKDSKTLGKCSIAYHRSAYPKGKPDGEYSLPIN